AYFPDEQKNKLINFIKAKNNKFKSQVPNNNKLENFERNISLYNWLYKHQVDGIRILSENNSVILADDMGLGKTLQGIVYAEIQQYEKILIICPASLKLNWKREIQKVNKKSKICVLPSDTPTKFTKYYIINYDML